jgi:hypothetical protein
LEKTVKQARSLTEKKRRGKLVNLTVLREFTAFSCFDSTFAALDASGCWMTPSSPSHSSSLWHHPTSLPSMQLPAMTFCNTNRMLQLKGSKWHL